MASKKADRARDKEPDAARKETQLWNQVLPAIKELTTELSNTATLKDDLARMWKESVDLDNEVLENTARLWRRLGRMRRYAERLQKLGPDKAGETANCFPFTFNDWKPEPLKDHHLGSASEANDDVKPAYGIVEMADDFESLSDSLDRFIQALEDVKDYASVDQIIGQNHHKHDEFVGINSVYEITRQFQKQIHHSMNKNRPNDEFSSSEDHSS